MPPAAASTLPLGTAWPVAPGDPLPLDVKRSGWVRFVGPAISAAILVAVAWQLRTLDLATLRAAVPANPVFWIVFAVLYFTGPAADFLIFRRLWRIPASGFIALLKKGVSNELLLGYLGEVYFYSWARRTLKMPTSPFGAVKDSAILSALAGNIVTLAMLAVAWPLMGAVESRIDMNAAALSVAVLMAISLGVLIFSKRVFSLSRGQLWMVLGIHLGRVVAVLGLSALAWSLALPTVAIAWWVLLATVRQLLSRLPFLPNKDVVFAGLAAFLVGQDVAITALMALMATLILTAHLALGAVLGIHEFVSRKVYQ